MTTHSSATAHEDTPHATDTTPITVSDTVRRRARSLINDRSVDPEWRTIIRYALEIDDPMLAELVNRAEAGERIIDTFESWRTPDADEDDSSREKIEALADIICGAGDQAAAALFVLMGTLQNSEHPEVLAHTVKHFAFTRCGEFNVFGMVDAQLAIIESELLARDTLKS